MRVLLLAALLVIAGCVAPASPGSDTESGTETPTAASVSSTSGSCSELTKPTPTDSPDVEAGSYPEPPTAWSTGSVATYVEAYESALLRNEALAGENLSYLEVYVQDVNVTKHEDIYVVRLQSYTNGGYYGQSGEGTPMVVHWDGAPKPVSYLVTGDRLVRAESNGYDDHVSLSRLRNGTTFECF